MSALRVAALGVVFLLTAAVGYDVMNTPPTYLESATVLFSLPENASSPAADLKFTTSIITASEAMTQLLMSSQIQRKIHEAGGTGNVEMALVNLYDEEYPNYGLPLASLTATSPSAATAHRTFKIATLQVNRLLAARQVGASIQQSYRISARIIGDTGPLVQKGSAKREFAGLAVLALVAISGLWSIADRRTATGIVTAEARSRVSSAILSRIVTRRPAGR
jgi:hypothetical protein